LKGGGVEDFNELSNRPLEITTEQVDSGVGTDPVLITPTKAKAMIEKHSTGHIINTGSVPTPLSTCSVVISNGLFDNSLKSSTPPPLSKSSAIVGFVLIT
jgi:hypothetical protein